MQQDDNGMLQAMYEEYQNILRTVARKSGIPYDDVDDIVQDTFFAYYTNYPMSWLPSQKKAMLMRILKNNCVDYFRKNSHYNQVSLDAPENFDEAGILNNYVMRDALSYILEDETKRELHKIVMNMKKDWRDVAILHFIEGRTIREVSTILEIKEPACRMRISRIRRYLNKKL